MATAANVMTHQKNSSVGKRNVPRYRFKYTWADGVVVGVTVSDDDTVADTVDDSVSEYVALSVTDDEILLVKFMGGRRRLGEAGAWAGGAAGRGNVLEDFRGLPPPHCPLPQPAAAPRCASTPCHTAPAPPCSGECVWRYGGAGLGVGRVHGLPQCLCSLARGHPAPTCPEAVAVAAAVWQLCTGRVAVV